MRHPAPADPAGPRVAWLTTQNMRHPAPADLEGLRVAWLTTQNMHHPAPTAPARLRDAGAAAAEAQTGRNRAAAVAHRLMTALGRSLVRCPVITVTSKPVGLETTGLMCATRQMGHCH